MPAVHRHARLDARCPVRNYVGARTRFSARAGGHFHLQITHHITGRGVSRVIGLVVVRVVGEVGLRQHVSGAASIDDGGEGHAVVD